MTVLQLILVALTAPGRLRADTAFSSVVEQSIRSAKSISSTSAKWTKFTCGKMRRATPTQSLGSCRSAIELRPHVMQ